VGVESGGRVVYVLWLYYNLSMKRVDLLEEEDSQGS